MSEKIYLKVPSKPAAEEVACGNFSAKLTPGKVIAVENRKFADFLVREYALAEVDAADNGKVKTENGKPEATESEDQESSGNKNGGKK